MGETLNKMAAMSGVALAAGGALPAATQARSGEIPYIPADAQHEINHHALYMTNSGCSGQEFENKLGQVVAAELAAHCNTFLDSKNPHITATDGKTYIKEPPIFGASGRRSKHLHFVDQFSTFIAPAAGDYDHDLVIAVAPGHTPKEAYRAVKEQSLTTPAQIRQVIGRTVFNASWPVIQPLNFSHEFYRQEYAEKVIGMGHGYNTQTGQRMALAWTVTDPSQQGSSCTGGKSGSGGELRYHGRWKSIGVASLGLDLSGDGGNNYTDPYVDGKVGLCSYAYELPPLKQENILHAVSDYKELPGYRTPEAAIAAARTKFEDPNSTLSVVDGQAEFTLMKRRQKGGEPQHGGPDLYLASNVYIDHDPKFLGTVIGTADPKDTDNLTLQFFDDQALKNLVIYANSDGEKPQLIEVNGKPDYQADQAGKSSRGYFVGHTKDGKEFDFGAIYNRQPPSNSLWQLKVVNNHLEFVPYPDYTPLPAKG